MNGLLAEICASKRQEIARCRKARPLPQLKRELSRANRQVRPFREALADPGRINIIAEIKRRSPSAGVIREGCEPAEIAHLYEEHGARALSVLTDGKYFGGNLAFVPAVREATGLPVLRKEFILDEYQVLESAGAGADAILLITRLLDQNTLQAFLALAHSFKLASLVEVHDEADLEKALAAGAEIIGINNRNLDTLQVDLETTLRLSPLIPKGKVVVSESGIGTYQDIARLKQAGVNAFLVGETLMKAKDPGAQLRALRGE